MASLDGKRGAIVGVANHRSIAWAIAQECAAQGAELIIAYQNERLEKGVRDLIAGANLNAKAVQCDVSTDEQIAHAFREISEITGGRLDFMVHSLAFAPKDDLQGRFTDTSREGFRIAMDISAYSLIALTRAAEPLMTEGGSIVTLTYVAAQRAIPGYGIMSAAKAALENEVMVLASELGAKNIRVNAVSAGPINTLAARGIRSFNQMREFARTRAPMGRDVETAEVARAAAFLLGDATATTGQVLYVDGGYSIMGF
ncbi:MAG: enoyl-ACP reductase [Chloroflexi bacterium]|nr:enoyl-ACP reductase [Chloroflexota bacterium]